MMKFILRSTNASGAKWTRTRMDRCSAFSSGLDVRSRCNRIRYPYSFGLSKPFFLKFWFIPQYSTWSGIYVPK